jgi:hypothetical protein
MIASVVTTSENEILQKEVLEWTFLIILVLKRKNFVDFTFVIFPSVLSKVTILLAQ